MIPVNQSVKHDPANGKTGDCFSATVASLLHLPLSEVPLFVSTDWQAQFNVWLRAYGLAYIQMVDLPGYAKENAIEGLWHEIAGYTDRHGGKELHAVVGNDSVVVHDPLGLDVEPLHEDNRLYGVFVLLEPWRWPLSKVPVKPVPKCAGCGTTKNLHSDPGSGGPWRCDSDDCVVF